ncbi:uncharacterized protein MYCFIDRAFT_204389 [Pseudocercospora fijiensis CIRAD86]|uniref:WW domain-containing protein n=1 Tax=Pseudocercospora fijiensis (strain CIRAD86) TaxID=383855 RepID=M2YQD5_PSEFD|nr:uncharacterized protein MYCFIDRAFT_204389 [Pseudocercospora fijiensis CIRAD86]EME79935.1 hypothetical protein MYCFIDRAFT_204389 [Pseudocercospora fijiensis CIRAD86]
MTSSNNHEELFLQSDSPANDFETPKPLQIKKQASPSSIAAGAGASEPQQQWAQYRVPMSSAAYGAPTSPPPSGPLPLPYPDERTRQQATPGAVPNNPPSRTATPQELASAEEGRAGIQPKRRKDSMSSQGSGGIVGRPKFDANDPNRPTLGGYGGSPLSSSRLAERRGAPSKSIFPPDSPGGPEPPIKSDEDEGLFQVKPQRKLSAQTDAEYSQQFYPPPLGAAPPATSAAAARMHVPDPAGINRLSSSASTSTTRASRGSPPPPETPIDGAGAAAAAPSGLTGIEARYAASGIPGASTLNEMQAQSAAAAARRAQYAQPQPRQGTLGVPQQTQQSSSGGRWSPTEPTGSAPHGPPITFQGVEEVASRGEAVPSQASRDRQPSYPRPAQPSTSPNHLAEDMNRMNVHEEPPPAYSPPTAGTVHSPYPNEKGRRPTDPNLRGHPAFANDPPQASASPQPASSQQNGATAGVAPINVARANQSVSPQPGPAGPASPPPLPEGWIAHLDNNSGHYYYIHLPTQSTQWEFPKGPTPLNLQEPMSPGAGIASPVGSVFKQPLASPGFPVQQMATYDRNSVFSMNPLASPTASGFTGPPPSAGVDMYKIAPSNAVYFGPYLRYTNMDLERGLWLGSIMLITDAGNQPPTIHLHQSQDLSPNPRQLKAHPIHSHQRWIFYRYDIDLRMEETGASKWTYAITSHLGCTRYEFLVAGRSETSWRFVAHSGNDFAINVSANDRSKLGGAAPMWKDVLVKHQECGGFHTQIGLGGQIYADRLWKDIPALRQWTQISGKENRKTAQWTAKMEEDVTHAYFHYYTSHFDQPAVKEAFAQIPQVCCLDDHDIFDGYGSYPEYMQESHVFKNLGRIGIEMYLLFQHHTTHEILRNVSNDIDLFTITGKGWHFLKYLGPGVVIVGPDTRSERNEKQVMAGPTYQGIFPKVATLPPSVQHCIWLMPVPIIYPRLEGIEQVASTVATGKKIATGSFNMLGKVTSGVAGIVGAKGVVNHGFDAAKKAVGKSGLMQGVLSPFGDIDMLDELRDLWTHESKDLERTYIIRTLQGISHNKSLRMTFLSGSVNSCGAGLVHDPQHPSDHKTMYQLITSSIVNAPTPSYILRMLHNNKQLYIPANGHRSQIGVQSDTKEDMMEIFAADVDGRPREHRRLMGRRNYLACVAYDPEVVQGAFHPQTPGQQPQGAGRLSLAADFMVQNDGAFGQPMKYGPVIIPSLDYGR